MKMYRRIVLERKDFLFSSLLFQIDLKFQPWCLVYKGRPLSIICLGFGRRTTCINKQPPATPAHLHRECPTDIPYGGSGSVARPPNSCGTYQSK